MNRAKRDEAIRELIAASVQLEGLDRNPALTPAEATRVAEARRIVEELIETVGNRRAA